MVTPARRTPHAQHQRNELLCDVNLVGLGAVVAHQQPTSQPLADGVETLAGRSQRLLVQTDHQGALEQSLQRGHVGQGLPKCLGFDAPAAAGAYHHRTPGHLDQSQHQFRTEHGLAPDHAHFHGWVAVDVEHHRDETCAGKVGVAKLRAAHAELGREHQFERLAQREKALFNRLGEQFDEVVFGVLHAAALFGNVVLPSHAIELAAGSARHDDRVA